MVGTPAKIVDSVRFAAFEFDCRTGELLRDGVALKLQPQPAKVLAALIRRSGEIVTRQDLVKEVWGSDVFVDYEQGLNYAIRQIRSALDDNAEEPLFLETLPKRGYRFIAALEAVTVPAQPQSVSVEQPSPPHRTLRRGTLVAVSVVVVVLIALTFGWGRLRRTWISSGNAPIRSLAVLPLHNLSRDPEQEYFSDGMTDELITDIARIDGLRVISHTSVERYKGTRRSLPEIARELGVDAIVEGTVLRSNDRVRITAQLIDARNDQHLWAQSYERDLRDVLGLQGDVARDIADKVAVRLTASQPERLWTARPVYPQAHEEYLKGIFDASKLTPDGLHKGIEHFDQAIALDPDYASAYAGKAEAYGWAAGFSILPPREVLPLARAAANKALELDDTLSQAHHSLAWVDYAYDWDLGAAEAHFRRAVELNPNDVTAHLWYGMFLAEQARIPESFKEMDRARELDPLSLMVNALGATPDLVDRRYDQVIARCERVLAMDPGNPVAHWMLYKSYEGKGNFSKAIDEMELLGMFGGDKSKASQLRSAVSQSGGAGYWRIRLQSLTENGAGADPYELAAAVAHNGDSERALQLLEKSYEVRSTELLYWVLGDPAFDSLRSDRRFLDLMRRSGIRKS